MASTSARARSIYRLILRELPQRPPSAPSPVRQYIRTYFAVQAPEDAQDQMDQAEQFIQYAKAQRMYTTLLKRYNPGLSMDEKKRVRMTARRVGMDLPEAIRMGNNF